MVRSAGGSDGRGKGDYVTLRLPSERCGWYLASATPQSLVSNEDHMNVNLGKAGKVVWAADPRCAVSR